MNGTLFVQSVPVRGGAYEVTLTVEGSAAQVLDPCVPMPTDTEIAEAHFWSLTKNVEDVELRWLWREQVYVVRNDDGSIDIRVAAGTGRGQTAKFDYLVGERIAKIRKSLGSELRKKGGGDDYRLINLTTEDVDHIGQLLEVEMIEQGDELRLVVAGQPMS